jgi:hypothetical protein
MYGTPYNLVRIEKMFPPRQFYYKQIEGCRKEKTIMSKEMQLDKHTERQTNSTGNVPNPTLLLA